MSDTPETDRIAKAACDDTGGLCRPEILRDGLERLERQRDSARESLEVALEHNQMHLNSDSIVGSCNCGTKTNEVKHHKPGCKYRLISERNEALQLVRELRDALGEIMDQYSTQRSQYGSEYLWEKWEDVEVFPHAATIWAKANQLLK